MRYKIETCNNGYILIIDDRKTGKFIGRFVYQGLATVFCHIQSLDDGVSLKSTPSSDNLDKPMIAAPESLEKLVVEMPD